MKRVVVNTGLNEGAIRPITLMSEFMRLSVIDASNHFPSQDSLVEVDCPACDSKRKRGAFRKNSFLYCECEDCRSVYVSPRPSAEDLDTYYTSSNASLYRVEHLARDTVKARRFHQLGTNANWLSQIVDEIGNGAARGYLDMGTALPEIFDEMGQLNLFDDLYCSDPLPLIADGLAERNVKVNTKDTKGVGVATAFEQLEHQFSPYEYFSSIKDTLEDQGLLFFTTRTISGFDLLTLWAKAPYIFVPEHLNLLSIDGITILLERSGFELVELSTPGQLDLEFVKRASEADPSIELPCHIRHILHHRDALAHGDFQAFLQKHRLSSHLRVAAQKTAASG